MIGWVVEKWKLINQTNKVTFVFITLVKIIFYIYICMSFVFFYERLDVLYLSYISSR